MRDRRRLLLLVLLTFAAAIAGVVIGRVYVVPVRPVENELHELLHRDLKLNSAQHSRLETIEKNYAIKSWKESMKELNVMIVNTSPVSSRR